ncbi:hypothetical protein Raf01_67970 [Rugosimonospora africana]|uniref:Uncharacterized protein n=1 Tax=Rugosimonospora africana TaxID=556532 RepID=A0A8J3VTX0_9ACTN|nr:hypothetical protein Raf01_67970 [Rugosimonospora africana]
MTASSGTAAAKAPSPTLSAAAAHHTLQYAADSRGRVGAVVAGIGVEGIAVDGIAVTGLTVEGWLSQAGCHGVGCHEDILRAMHTPEHLLAGRYIIEGMSLTNRALLGRTHAR